MSAREVKRRREGWVREGIVYEYIAAVPAKRAAVESKSVFSHRNRIGNALTIYTFDLTAHVVNGDVSRRSPRRVRTPRVVARQRTRRGAVGDASARRLAGDARALVASRAGAAGAPKPASEGRGDRGGCSPRRGRAKTPPRAREPLARTPRGGVLMPDSRWTRATARGARRRRVLALGAAGILLGEARSRRAPPPRAPQGGRGCEGVSRHRRHADARPKVLTRAEF